MERNLVSIITPLYNCENFIEATIRSVQQQTYKNWEMIIVDDCSTDNGVNIAQKYSAIDDRIKFYKLDKNSGVIVARNFGLEKASGRYISFLDSDDLFHYQKLEKQLDFIKKNNISICFTSYQKINEDGTERGIITSQKDRINYYDLLKSNIMPTFSVVYDTEKIGKKYFKDFNKSEDYIYWLDILKNEEYVYRIKDVLGYYRVRQKSRSSNKLSSIYYQWKIYRKIEDLSIIESLYYFITYLYLGLIRFIT